MLRLKDGVRWLAAVVALGAFAVAVEADAAPRKRRKGRKKPGMAQAQERGGRKGGGARAPARASVKAPATTPFGVYAGLGLQTLSIKDADPKFELGGFAFGMGGLFDLALTPTVTLPMSAGFSVVSLNGATEGDEVTVNFSVNTLDFAGGMLYYATPSVALGMLFEFTYAISGSTKVTVENPINGETEESTGELESLTATAFVPAIRFHLTPAFFLAADYAIQSGSYLMAKDPDAPEGSADPEAQKFDGTRIRISGAYKF